jgi:hypothetical protein
MSIFDGQVRYPEVVAPDVVIQLRRQIAFEKGVFGKRAKQAAVHKSPSRLFGDIGHFSC